MREGASQFADMQLRIPSLICFLIHFMQLFVRRRQSVVAVARSVGRSLCNSAEFSMVAAAAAGGGGGALSEKTIEPDRNCSAAIQFGEVAHSLTQPLLESESIFACENRSTSACLSVRPSVRPPECHASPHVMCQRPRGMIAVEIHAKSLKSGSRKYFSRIHIFH